MGCVDSGLERGRRPDAAMNGGYSRSIVRRLHSFGIVISATGHEPSFGEVNKGHCRSKNEFCGMSFRRWLRFSQTSENAGGRWLRLSPSSFFATFNAIIGPIGKDYGSNDPILKYPQQSGNLHWRWPVLWLAPRCIRLIHGIRRLYK